MTLLGATIHHSPNETNNASPKASDCVTGRSALAARGRSHLTLSILNWAMLSHSSVYPARPPRPPFVAPRVCVVLRGISRCLAPDILRALAGEHSGACGRLAVLSRLGHARNIRSAGLRTPAGPRLRTCV